VLGRARPRCRTREHTRRSGARRQLDTDGLGDQVGHPRARIDKRGGLRQHYETDALDASTLLAAIFGFLPGDDPRLRATVLAVADELSKHGFVQRSRTDQTDDGLSGKEGSFVICSFWLVSGLAIVGQTRRARELMERLVTAASPLGLYAEEFDVETGRHLGNFPQAFSHLALVEAAARLIVAEGFDELVR
jgi:alpha,alpha-trehalase